MKTYNWKDINIRCDVDFKESYIEFKMYEIIGEESELYIEGSIKWDACSHIYFGDEGYIHICGGRSWRDFIESNKRIFNIAREYFDEEHQKEEFDEYDEIIK